MLDNIPKNVLIQPVSSPNSKQRYHCYCVTINSLEYVGKIHIGFGLFEPWDCEGNSLGAFFDSQSCLEFLLKNHREQFRK